MVEEQARSDADTTAETGEHDVIIWEFRVPLLTSRFMLWDFARVIVLSVLSMYVLVALMGWFVDGEFVWLPAHVSLIAGGAMAALFAIACLLLLNRFTMEFSVGPDGVGYGSGSRERKWNRAAVIIGVLGGRPGTAGAGLIASSQEEGGWAWADLHRAIEHPDQFVITLRNSWRTVLRLHCTRENYEQVRAAVAEGLQRGASERAAYAAAAPPAVRRPWHAYAAAALVPAVATVLVTAWPWLQYEDGMRWIVVAAVLLVGAGLLGGCARRVLAAVSLLPTGYIVYLTVAEMFTVTEGWLPDERISGWEFDTGLLAVTLAGEAILIGLALWRLFGQDASTG